MVLISIAYGLYPPINPNWFKQQELMAKYGHLIGQLSGISVQATEEAKPKEEKKEEVRKVEKVVVDILLKKIEPASKIKLIKEIRGMLSIGLKDAKELIEKAPVKIMKNVPPKDAEGIKKMLEGFGATIEIQ